MQTVAFHPPRIFWDETTLRLIVSSSSDAQDEYKLAPRTHKILSLAVSEYFQSIKSGVASDRIIEIDLTKYHLFSEKKALSFSSDSKNIVCSLKKITIDIYGTKIRLLENASYYQDKEIIILTISKQYAEHLARKVSQKTVLAPANALSIENAGKNRTYQLAVILYASANSMNAFRKNRIKRTNCISLSSVLNYFGFNYTSLSSKNWKQQFADKIDLYLEELRNKKIVSSWHYKNCYKQRIVPPAQLKDELFTASADDIKRLKSNALYDDLRRSKKAYLSGFIEYTLPANDY